MSSFHTFVFPDVCSCSPIVKFTFNNTSLLGPPYVTQVHNDRTVWWGGSLCPPVGPGPVWCGEQVWCCGLGFAMEVGYRSRPMGWFLTTQSPGFAISHDSVLNNTCIFLNETKQNKFPFPPKNPISLSRVPQHWKESQTLFWDLFAACKWQLQPVSVSFSDDHSLEKPRLPDTCSQCGYCWFSSAL